VSLCVPSVEYKRRPSNAAPLANVDARTSGSGKLDEMPVRSRITCLCIRSPNGHRCQFRKDHPNPLKISFSPLNQQARVIQS
jgi:hypothetical protein